MNPHRHIRIVCSLIALSMLFLAGCAPVSTDGVAASPATGTSASTALAALSTIAPKVAPDRVGDAPLKGFKQFVVDGRVVYVSNDGKFLIQGMILDIAQRRNLTEDALASVRRDVLAKIPLSDRIVFAPKNPRYTVTVFTDVQCGYCRKFHEDIQAYNDLGIAVQYVAFPRAGIGSDDYARMESVWCSPDRKAALTAAKRDRGALVAPCANSPVAREFEAGRKAGLAGTPMIVAEDGTQLGGYLAPAELRAALEQLASATPARS